MQTGGVRKAWRHAGGKLREMGADRLTEEDLLAVVVSTGVPGRTAQAIAADLLREFGSLEGMAGQPLERFLKIRGMGDVKILRVAAALEIGRRLALRARGRTSYY